MGKVETERKWFRKVGHWYFIFTMVEYSHFSMVQDNSFFFDGVREHAQVCFFLFETIGPGAIFQIKVVLQD